MLQPICPLAKCSNHSAPWWNAPTICPLARCSNLSAPWWNAPTYLPPGKVLQSFCPLVKCPHLSAPWQGVPIFLPPGEMPQLSAPWQGAPTFLPPGEMSPDKVLQAIGPQPFAPWHRAPMHLPQGGRSRIILLYRKLVWTKLCDIFWKLLSIFSCEFVHAWNFLETAYNSWAGLFIRLLDLACAFSWKLLRICEHRQPHM